NRCGSRNRPVALTRALTTTGAGRPGAQCPTTVKKLLTKELSTSTWPDYVKFFSQGNGWDHCACMAWQGFRSPSTVRRWADRRDWNLELKYKLVASDLAHGILVYSNGEPVGWCQYGAKGELPIPEAQRRTLLMSESGSLGPPATFQASASPSDG